MRLFAGIDGGQSSTRAVVADSSGVLLGRGVAGPADEVAQDRNSTRMRDALHASLDDALRAANISRGVRFESIVAGLSGYEGTVYGIPPSFDAERFTVVHDAPVAHAGALRGGPGVIVIAGTGSVAYAVDERGAARTVGGYGYLFGDGGSAFWMARAAVTDAALHERCDAAAALREYFARPSIRAIARAFYAGEIPRDAFASFASVVLQGARSDGSGCLAAIAAAAARSLAELAARAWTSGSAFDCAFVGGLMQDPAFKGSVVAQLQTVARGVDIRIVEPAYDPAVGALLLAYSEAGLDFPEIRER